MRTISWLGLAFVAACGGGEGIGANGGVDASGAADGPVAIDARGTADGPVAVDERGADGPVGIDAAAADAGAPDGGTTTDPQARAMIGAAGGEVAFPDQRFTLTIPAGALGDTVEIVVTDLAAENVPENLRSLDADKVYRLEPAGTQFAMPVRATARLPPSDAIALLVHESNGTIEHATESVTLAEDGRIVSGTITHFSNLAVATRSVLVRVSRTRLPDARAAPKEL